MTDSTSTSNGTTIDPNKNVCEDDSGCTNEDEKCVDIYDYKLKLLITKCCKFPELECLSEEKGKKNEKDKDDGEKVPSSTEKL